MHPDSRTTPKENLKQEEFMGCSRLIVMNVRQSIRPREAVRSPVGAAIAKASAQSRAAERVQPSTMGERFALDRCCYGRPGRESDDRMSRSSPPTRSLSR